VLTDGGIYSVGITQKRNRPLGRFLFCFVWTDLACDLPVPKARLMMAAQFPDGNCAEQICISLLNDYPMDSIIANSSSALMSSRSIPT